MRYSELASTAVIAALAVSMGAAPAAAKAGGSAKAKTTVRAASVKPSAAKAPSIKTASTPRLKTNRSATVKPSATTARPTLTNAKPTAAKPTLSNAKPTKPTSKPTSTNAKPDGRPTTNNAPPAPVPNTIPLNKAQRLLAKNTNLRMKLQSRLPPGMDVMAAASGFRNLGQFVAAVNVSSKNPDINFLNLKSLMVGDSPMSLGQAVQQIKGLNAATADSIANTARVQANADIAESSSTAAKKVKTKS